MPIPDYQTLMLPVLKLLADGQERSFHQLLPPLADQYHLTEEERARLLPSGRQQMFRNRVHWASFYLLKAGLLERPRRGHLRITPRGIEASKRGGVNNAYLKQFPSFENLLAVSLLSSSRRRRRASRWSRAGRHQRNSLRLGTSGIKRVWPARCSPD